MFSRTNDLNPNRNLSVLILKMAHKKDVGQKVRSLWIIMGKILVGQTLIISTLLNPSVQITNRKHSILFLLFFLNFVFHENVFLDYKTLLGVRECSFQRVCAIYF